ncbi:YeeE/YedE family protein [Polynucleobacter sp. AP-Nino-20-G2]|uniref:YeeE/YedE family protein n=1 Tax=Polynucleobacter sp. AP-Nino-20-G2 TaxID=2576917 RepID=UPI001BFEA208|nr:YeeE/YedE family protein [Polynucleobacter sp. AP-Nino-20-G2]QWE15751.1 YeeE/YedE family protein [Polynucleobacter sp. AP-Nino-20-G2]
MDAVDISSLSKYVLISTFAITFLLGAVMQKTGFCSMGAVSDVFIMSSWDRLRQWFLAIGVAIVGFAFMSYLGLIDPLKSIYTSSKLLWLSTLVGSVMFGFGMVLASGCGSKTLVRIGGGNLKSVIVFLVLGLSAYMTLKGFLGVIRINTLDSVFITLSTPQDLPSILSPVLGVARSSLHLALGLLVGFAFIGYALASKAFWTAENIFAGVLVGLAICAVWWISGSLGYVAEDPNTLEEVFLVTNSGRMESLSFVAPYAYSLDWLMMYSDTSKVMTVGIAAVIGMISGSAFIALVTKSFRWETFRNTEDTANHLVGAALMGFGGVTALGCTVGQGLSGISTLAIGSFFALPGFIFGAYMALRYLQVRLAPNPCS